MRQPSFVLVADSDGFSIHELNEYHANRHYCGPFVSVDDALHELRSLTGNAFAIPLVESRL